MNRARYSISGLGLAALLAACSSGTPNPSGSGGTTGTGGSATGGGTPSGGTGTGGATGGGNPSGGSATGGGNPSGGSASGGSTTGGSGGAGNPSGGAGPGTGGAAPIGNVLVTSGPGAYWKVAATMTEGTGTATVTVNDTTAKQTWEGFGGAFNEMGWNVLTSKALQDEAIKLLFSATDGANFAWGRIPMGASDYAMDRYTLDDTGSDVTAMSGDSNRPPADTALAMFSLARDGQKLIPYIKAAQVVKPDLRFWASPWTPPVWMKTGYKTNSGADSSKMAKKPSYFDGGNMKSDAAILTAYAQYYTKFVTGYKDMGIKIEIVSPQNEPGYDQNYPSCLWDATTYANFVGKYLGPAMKTLDVKVMLGTMSNDMKDIALATSVAADATAKSFLTVAGAQWGVLAKVIGGQSLGGLPVWATEHKCGNYPWNEAGYPAYNNTMAPNDQAYGEESWGYIRDAITKGGVTSYNAWNMVLDKLGLGNDTTRDWKQNALLVSDGTIKPTPTYYVFRHFSQYVTPGAKVVTTTGGDAVGFKNPDGSLVAVAFSKDANASFTVAIGGKKFQANVPAKTWVTVKYKP